MCLSGCLAFLQAAAARDGLSSIQVEHAGFLTFEAPPDSVDVVVSRLALHHLPDFWKQVALTRIRAVLRSRGRLYLRDVVFSFKAYEYEAAVEGWVGRMPHASGFSQHRISKPTCGRSIAPLRGCSKDFLNEQDSRSWNRPIRPGSTPNTCALREFARAVVNERESRLDGSYLVTMCVRHNDVIDPADLSMPRFRFVSSYVSSL